MVIEAKNEEDVNVIGARIGAQLVGGEIIELIGDVGAGKTTLVRAIAIGLRISENIQSPSYTISRVYQARDNLSLVHYDFYRLTDPGIMANDIQEVIEDNDIVVAIEWGGLVENVLPADRLTVRITAPTETSRTFDISSGGPDSQKLLERIK